MTQSSSVATLESPESRVLCSLSELHQSGNTANVCVKVSKSSGPLRSEERMGVSKTCCS